MLADLFVLLKEIAVCAMLTLCIGWLLLCVGTGMAEKRYEE